MLKKTPLDLKLSEATVLHAASRIFSAYLVQGKMTEENEQKWIERSIEIAIKMAQLVDIRVESDGEVKSLSGL
jgi:hypothetical protein